ncbi:YibE/F family protein [Fusibacter sp. JL216-2]|uniref:YibE/F family protein n=1 Tax=Fusibacter sp. JL216-2 TaxID=3071453 RepID=UPI003D3365EE
MKRYVFIVFVFVLTSGLLMQSTGENRAGQTQKITELHATVVSVDDSGLIHTGVVPYGPQFVDVTFTDKDWAGQRLSIKNHLMGKADIDTPCQVGDAVIVGVKIQDNKIMAGKILEHDRTLWLSIMAILFVSLLVGYAGMIGIKSLISFILSVWIIWDVLVRGLLEGKEPIFLISWVIVLLSAIIIFSVAGLTRKGVSAFLGTLLGLGFTVILTVIFGSGLKVNGMTLPFAEALIFNGNLSLNMREIFYGAVLLGASGASMDIAMDVAASMEEIKIKKPDIERKELILSGIKIGRHVIGTMSTTLLLAYSGGFITLLMLFMTKSTKLSHILNLKIVASEIMRTLIGSTNLILVAPLTALIAGWLLCQDQTFESLYKSKPDAEEMQAENI